MKKYYKFEPDSFSTKWLGIIYLSQNDLENSKKYLSESLKYKSNDPQVYYNLAGAYMLDRNYPLADNMIDNCLNVEKKYPGAQELKNKILKLML